MTDDGSVKPATAGSENQGRTAASPAWLQILLAVIALLGVVFTAFMTSGDKKKEAVTSAPATNVTVSPTISPVFNNNATPTPTETNSQSSAARSTDPILACMTPADRPIDGAKPGDQQLIDSLIVMVTLSQNCVKQLVDYGVDINGYGSSSNFNRGPALHLAIISKKWSTATYLLSKGADPNLYYEFPATHHRMRALQLSRDSYAPESVVNEIILHGGT
jgi:hypothetical protein